MLSIVLAAVLALASGRAVEPIQPTPTPLPGGFLASPTPTSRPIPSDPSAALDQARRLLAAGVPDEAARVVSAALGAPDPTVRTQARLVLAQATLASGDAGVALELAVEAARRAPEPSLAGMAAVVVAQALVRSGDTAGGVEQLLAARASLPEVAPYLEYRALDPLVQSGRGDEALRLVDHVVATAPIRRLAVAALEWRRARAEQQGDLETVRATLDRLLELATIPTYRATLLLQRARVARALGDPTAAQADLLAAIDAAPESSVAAMALDELDALGSGQAIAADRRAAIAFAAGRYAAAVAAYGAVLEADPTRADAWYQRAIARIRSGDLAGGIQELEVMEARYPQDGRTSEALVTAGTLVEWQDEAAATALYERVLARYPSSSAAHEARFRLGLLAYGQGDAASAATLWSEQAERDARFAFWYGKALAASGDFPAARRAWQRAQELDPTGFYGIRSGELLAGRAPVAEKPTGERLDPTESALSHWIAEFGLAPDDISARLAASGPVRRALVLLDLGDREAAGWEVDAARDALRDDPVTLALFARELLRRGEFAYAYRVGAQLQESGGLPSDVTAVLVAPVPFPEVLDAVGARVGVDPLLLAALVRQESAFEPTAVSPAGARGLTQVLPATAAGLAAQLGLGDWTADLLFRPATSLLLGGAELARRLEQFQGQRYLALASYNAGAGAVLEWQRERPTSDPDLLVEWIPYRETYAYVQRVYAGYRLYQRLYLAAG
ncbi:MAG: transglycosylase SLT domain-containing protein [Thermomicrobium sp.]|nr:transglycosylase SLT domain-containing protein [Thermomicrobium sp.]